MLLRRVHAMALKTSSIVLTLILACCLAVAQTQPAPVAQPAPLAPKPSDKGQDADVVHSDATFRSWSNLVNVVFTVTDKHGKFVKDMKQSQFKVLDNNLPPKEITNFEAETNLPLRVGLLIDASNSIRDKFLFEQQ